MLGGADPLKAHLLILPKIKIKNAPARRAPDTIIQVDVSFVSLLSDDDEHEWIIRTCRKGWDEIVGFQKKKPAPSGKPETQAPHGSL